MGDHALFFHLGLEDKDHVLKNKAKEINEKWQAYMKKEFYNKGIPLEEFDIENPKKVKISLNAEDYGKIGDINGFDFDGLFNLLNETREFKMEVKRRLENNEWLGWLFYSFAIHVIMELDAFYARILGKQSVAADIQFYNKMSKDHSGFAEKLSDTVKENEDLENLLRSAYNQDPKLNETITENQQYKLLSLKYLEMIEGAAIDLQSQVHNNQIKFTIHPNLIDHVVREQSNATAKLLLLKDQI
jgi:hypothetical protein